MIILDDNIDDHPKFVSLSNDAFALWVRGVGYCRRNLTDGFIPSAWAMSRARSADPSVTICELVTASPGCANPLWSIVDGGYQIHDYLEWNPSRADVAAKVEANREKGRRGGLRSGAVRSQQPSQRLSHDSTQSEAKAKPPASIRLDPEPSKQLSPVVGVGLNQNEPRSDPIRSDPYTPSECVARTHETLAAGHLTAEAIAAELAAHPQLAAVASEPTLPATLLGRAVTKGTKATWLAAAIADAAADTPSGEQAHAVQRRLRAYCDRARPPQAPPATQNAATGRFRGRTTVQNAGAALLPSPWDIGLEPDTGTETP